MRQAVVILVLAVSGFARAQTWIGGAGNWTDATKWQPGSSPHGQSSDVFIDGGKVVVSTVNMDRPLGATIRNLTISAGDTLDLNVSHAFMEAFGNLTIDGTLKLSDYYTRLTLAGGGSKTIGGAGQVIMTVGQGGIDGGFNWGTAITIGPNLTIRGSGGIQAGSTLTNNGTIISEGMLSLYGAVNNGTLRASGSNSLSLVGVRNAGSIILEQNAYLSLLGNTLATDDLGVINRQAGTTVALLGVLNNTGRILDLQNSTGTLVINTGTIRGGVVKSSGAAELKIDEYKGGFNTLDNVTLATSPRFEKSLTHLTVANTLTLDNITIHLSGGAGNLTNNQIAGGDLRGTGTIVLGTQANGNNQVVSATIGPGILVRGTGVVYGINQGVIRADVAGASIQLYHVENDGVIHAASGGHLAISTSGSRPLINRGVLRIDSGSTLNVPFDQALNQTAGSLRVNGTVTTSLQKLSVSGGTISGTGTFSATPFQTTVNKFNFGGILSPGATDDGVGSVGTLTVQSNLSFASGSGLKVEAGGVGADLLRVVAGGGASGNLEIGPGAQLHVQPSGNLVYGTKYVIATYAGTITGIFEQVSEGFVVDYSVAKQISVMVVPEPAAACGAALAGMLVLRRRR